MGLTVSEKSVFPTSFGRGRFQGNLFSFILIFSREFILDLKFDVSYISFM